MVVRRYVPGIAAVVGAIDSAFFCLDDCPHSIGTCARDRHSDAAQNPFRQSVSLEFLPGCAAVDRTVKAASRAAAIQTPRSPPRLPQCREQDVRIAGIE